MQNIKTEIRSWLWVGALLLLLAAAPDDVRAGLVDPGEARAGSLLWSTEQGYRAATRLDTDVDISVSGLVARVSVRQSFRNEGRDWLEGLYVFPLPERAAVERLRVRAGERVIEGEVREKEQAEKLYAQARQSGRKAGLVQQRRANLFTTSLANVAPGETVVVEIEYLEELRFEQGRFSLRFPMTLTPRYVPGLPLVGSSGAGWSPDTSRVPDASHITPPQVAQSRGHRVTLTARVDAGLPLAIVASRYHPVSVHEQGGRYTVTLDGGGHRLDHDFELVWQPVATPDPRALLFTETFDGRPHYLLMLTPPAALTAAPRVPRETVFVVDTSGSMHGASMAQARQALRMALRRLQAGDRFNVIAFSSRTTALYPESRSSSAANVATALRFVAGLEAQGGTEMLPALAFALDSPPSPTHLRQVVFITDGSVGYEDEMFTLIEQRLGAARLFTVGIGSAPNSLFMRKAAEAGRGSYTFVSDLHEVAEKMQGLFLKLEQPQVTGIEVQWPASVDVVSFPARVPDLYAGEPVALRARASGPLLPGDSVRISGDSPQGGWVTDVPLDAAASGQGIATLWARARLDALEDAERRGGDAELLRAAIVATGLAYRLVSRYTSMVAVDRTPARPAGEGLATEAVPSLMPRGQSAGAIFGLPATATPAPLQRLVGGLSLLAALLLAVLLHVRGRHSDAAHA